MDYYIFQNSTEPKEIGLFPQAEIARTVDTNAFDCPWNVKAHEFPDFVPQLEFILNRGALLTDIVSTVGINHGFVVNDRVRSILKDHKLPEHAFYPLKLYWGKNIFEYYWFHFINRNFWDWIDKERSKLYLRSILPSKREIILDEVNLQQSDSEFILMDNNRPRLTGYYWDKVVFNHQFPKFDIFSMPNITSNTMISESLYHNLLQNKIIGFEIKELCEIVMADEP